MILRYMISCRLVEGESWVGIIAGRLEASWPQHGSTVLIPVSKFSTLVATREAARSVSTAYIKEIKEVEVSRRGGGGGGGEGCGKRPRLNMYKLCSRNRKRE